MQVSCSMLDAHLTPTTRSAQTGNTVHVRHDTREKSTLLAFVRHVLRRMKPFLSRTAAK